MALIRDDVQVALHDLHVALKHSADSYSHAADFLNDAGASNRCRSIASERDKLAALVAAAVREAGDLPAVPDSEREVGEQLLQRLESLFSADQAREVMAQRREADRELLTWLEGEDLSPLEKGYSDLLLRCRASVSDTLAHFDSE
ncbi:MULTISPECIES: hypothetical protein [Microbulbifer]|uniref:hypothetical protein n=1 Tax=Microbulbifer TaxID=48073 RepID=UPI001E455809|nr:MULTISPECIES: hypothetical protein [Microbulbifer]UHQ55907.1 hypothetical protein LVE68_02675 [Microbulbifer sp. YPW16]